MNPIPKRFVVCFLCISLILISTNGLIVKFTSCKSENIPSTLMLYKDTRHVKADDAVIQVDGPNTLTYDTGSTGNTIEWHFNSSIEISYEVFRNRESIDDGFTTSGVVTIDIDGLRMGLYNFTILLEDSTSNTASDTVWVYVVDEVGKRIILDYSHGQEDGPHEVEDANFESNLTALGYDVIWAKGGINDTLLADADALIIGAIHQEENNYTTEEITAIADWYSTGEKFLWVAGDADYEGHYVNHNMSAILKAVNSHVYPENTQIEDPESNVNADYRVIANETDDARFISPIVEGVNGVLMHGPTCLYGSEHGDGTGAVNLIDQPMSDIYPVLYYSSASYIDDHDGIMPVAHEDSESGPMVAMTVEINAGAAESGIIIVSGASPYGDYIPMYRTEYYDYHMQGDRLVLQAIQFSMYYPLSAFENSPILSSPSNVFYAEGEFGYSIIWNPEDSDPSSYTLYMDNTPIRNGLWNSTDENITVNVDGHSLGVYNYTLVVEDVHGHVAIDTVMVTVTDETDPIIDHPSDVSFLVGQTGQSIEWHPEDDNPNQYAIGMDGHIVRTGQWNSTAETISLNLDGLAVGVHNVTITVWDASDNQAHDIVTVTVLAATTTDDVDVGIPNDLMAMFGIIVTMGSLAVVIVVIAMVFKRKRSTYDYT